MFDCNRTTLQDTVIARAREIMAREPWFDGDVVVTNLPEDPGIKSLGIERCACVLFNDTQAVKDPPPNV